MTLSRYVFVLFLLIVGSAHAQYITPFEATDSQATSTYGQCIKFYENLAKNFKNVSVKTFGSTDAGYPLHVIETQTLGTQTTKKNSKVLQAIPTILINNAIHPGEPDGVDASMMLVRDIALGKINTPTPVKIVIIPIYNIGGSLNRSGVSRVNQNGPISYGFRGNAQNLDLNRDFIKADSREAITFTQIFHTYKPHVFIDNHVSDGADYQHVMTLLTTQHNKLGGPVGEFLHQTFEPAIYASMKQKNFPLVPYVNFEDGSPETGWQAFFDGPRYSSGFAALHGALAFVPETHMLKPFKDRVLATFELLKTILQQTSHHAKTIVQNKALQQLQMATATQYPISWKVDSTRVDSVVFMGYKAETKGSKATLLPILSYNHTKPFTKTIPFYNYLVTKEVVNKPKLFIIPQGWHAVLQRLQANGVPVLRFANDTVVWVQCTRIKQYKPATRPYEKHFKHSQITTETYYDSV
ncbi:MAG: hypothetical protein EAY68_06055, partial [Bacteroidetes bacterium]